VNVSNYMNVLFVDVLFVIVAAVTPNVVMAQYVVIAMYMGHVMIAIDRIVKIVLLILIHVKVVTEKFVINAQNMKLLIVARAKNIFVRMIIILNVLIVTIDFVTTVHLNIN